MSGEPAPPDPRIGATLQGRYLILSKVASGAMGVVYKGERVQLGKGAFTIVITLRDDLSNEIGSASEAVSI